jgi:hypothetical protein
MANWVQNNALTGKAFSELSWQLGQDGQKLKRHPAKIFLEVKGMSIQELSDFYKNKLIELRADLEAFEKDHIKLLNLASDHCFVLQLTCS